MIRFRFAVSTVFIVVGGLVWFTLVLRPHRSRPQLHAMVKVGFRVGDRAPDFDLRSLDGRNLKLSDLRGKLVLLNFWATWCAPCRVEMPWLVELDEKYRAQEFQIVGISMDDSGAAQTVAAFVREEGVKYPIVLGTSATADAYGGVRFLPQTFFIDRDGKIVKATSGITRKQDLEDGAKALLACHPPTQLAQDAGCRGEPPYSTSRKSELF